MSSSTSVRALVCLAAALGLLCFWPLRSLGNESARSMGSLTPDQRNHLPDNTQVTLPRRGAVTLGTLRAEHRARMERFSRADLWGKRVAERMPKPTPLSSQKLSGVPPGPNTSSLNRAANQVTVGDGKPGRPPVTGHQKSGAINQSTAATTAAVQPQQQGAAPLNKSGGGAAENNVARANSAVLATLIPRQTYNIPIPKDYAAFCNATLASACIYYPPNTTFATQDLKGDPPGTSLVSDVDPLITDAAACTSLGGSMDGMQECVFKYFFVQETSFKYPGGKASVAVHCDPNVGWGASSDSGNVWAATGLQVPFTTGATPVSCVVQLWFTQ